MRGGKKHQKSGEHQAILKKEDNELIFIHSQRHAETDLRTCTCSFVIVKLQVSLVGQIEKRK